MAFFKYVEIKGFVVGLVSFPAAEDDPNPFEGQNANGAVVGFALLALLRLAVQPPVSGLALVN